jgi:RNA-binding protein
MVSVVEPKEFFMLELNSKQRKFLEKEAHNLSPVVIIGGAGVTEGVINMVSSSIASHELIKVKFNEYKDEKFDLTNEICEKTNATLVRVIGNVAILYRPAEEVEKRRYPQVV